MTSESVVEVKPTDNLLQALYDRSETNGDEIAVLVRSGDEFAPISVRDFLDQVRDIARGLIAAEVEVGDRVAIFSTTRLEWALLDYAIWQAGAVSVTIYETSSADQVGWILENSNATLAVVENDALRAVVEQARNETTAVRGVVTIDEGGVEALIEQGSGVSNDELATRAATIDHAKPATIVYTSGTSGRPKGCQLTHHNLIWTARQVIAIMPELVTSTNRTISFLPLAHILARIVQLTALTAGVPVAFGGGVPTLLDDLAKVKPTWLTVVPRVLEKVYDGATAKAGTGVKRRIFDWAAAVARRVGAHNIEGTVPSIPLQLAHKVADQLVLGSLRTAMGGELTFVISGGAPLRQDLAYFFNGAGVEVLEGYGLTETTGPATVDRVGRSKPGTVGPPLPGVEVRISDHDEIQLRGPSVAAGYWEDEADTADAFAESWFSTGDLGEIDSDGHLVITGRIKDLIVTAGGKNIAPAPLELGLAVHPLVSHAVVVGDDRPFVAALVTLDGESLTLWAREQGRQFGSPEQLSAELADDPELRAELQRIVDEVNSSVSRAEGIRAFEVLSADFTVESGELTPTMKVKRARVISGHAAAIERLYEPRQR